MKQINMTIKFYDGKCEMVLILVMKKEKIMFRIIKISKKKTIVNLMELKNMKNSKNGASLKNIVRTDFE